MWRRHVHVLTWVSDTTSCTFYNICNNNTHTSLQNTIDKSFFVFVLFLIKILITTSQSHRSLLKRVRNDWRKRRDLVRWRSWSCYGRGRVPPYTAFILDSPAAPEVVYSESERNDLNLFRPLIRTITETTFVFVTIDTVTSKGAIITSHTYTWENCYLVGDSILRKEVCWSLSQRTHSFHYTGCSEFYKKTFRTPLMSTSR